MAHYIDKDALVTKIDNLKHKIDDRYSYSNGWKDALYMVEAELDTLEVKEVDLEKEIDKWWWGKTWQTYGMILNQQNIMDFAKHFFELGIKVAQKGKNHE